MGKCYTKMAAQKNDSDVVIKANWKQGFLNDNIINRRMNTRLRLLLTMKYANIHGKLVRDITPLETLQGKTLYSTSSDDGTELQPCSSN